MESVDKVAFAIPLLEDRVQGVEDFARSITGDPATTDLARRLGAQRISAWIQEDSPPLLIVYMEWKVDPVLGLADYEMSQDEAARQIRAVLRQAASSPEDAVLDTTASRSELVFEWGCEDGSRGGDVRCYACVISPDKAAAAREFLTDFTDPMIRRLYGRLRERVGMKCIAIWSEETPSGDHLFVELYESDDLDSSFALLDRSAYELDEMNETRTALTFGWGPGNMPKLRKIFDLGESDQL